MKIVVGLGNPGEDYVNTRHNTGRIVVNQFLKNFAFPEMVFNKKLQALESVGKVGREKVQVVFPETFMNKSGSAVAKIITSKKKAKDLVVVHDDLDMPLGKIKISWNRGTGGHKGVLSIVKALKTEEFVRVRVGISAETAGGKLKKPKGEKEVDKFIIGEFRPTEEAELKKVAKRVSAALEVIVLEDASRAMGEFNRN
ncbi:MAG: hypothetical protein A2741_01430 [Candidatus Zambryskibacteria bacterium RIFCSPHIGHO2_01_FULL_43_27]|uniref:Peptidyl-tRNA hydrolase n=1 Tax=Candidatus Zambryskibacteria bacterium RIFCSPLOWO2_01_FULL_43_17 TaxID=1802760 RepID=A0A1G2U184_9BACT|nr:MAG: hypothetical protein A2741_01430 [Candidatus Zambryskibacteria bacterium RIFCSPHIGHO2_01_FULL_43_27]OHA99440.1 MAG: hypothetical protein A3E93_02540 [Candidatus Zambryskibacteria bacterium RIFCSPHIGHO2_12_FULL_43_12b]OHB03275.1 MAG: hypothetical protein A2920_00160 [Candidatus Zambryskibacteria bacterium RIFCSPLOWO2_01_FULL_43_17]